jgi:ankyrin repeat protein
MNRPNQTDDWFEQERLHRAAEDGDISEVQRLLASGFSLDSYDDISFTPLHYAARAEHYKVAVALLEAGANVNAHDQDRAGETAVGVAALGNYPEMVELLLQRGANPDIPGWMGLTARLRATRRTDEDGRKILALIECYRPSPKTSKAAR